MRDCVNCPYTDFKYFYDYYGKADYADHYVTSAFAGVGTTFTNGNADFSASGMDGMVQYIKKGTAYMNVFMYVIREYEDALGVCDSSCVDCNSGSVHTWDEGVVSCGG